MNAATRHIDRLAPNTNLPCSKNSHWYLNKNSKRFAITEAELYPGTGRLF